MTAHQRLDTAAAASTLHALRSHLDHELTEVKLLTSHASVQALIRVQVILWRVGSLRHMFSSTHCAKVFDAQTPPPPSVMHPNFFSVAIAALQLVREVRPVTGAFDSATSSSLDDSKFLVDHALCARPPRRMCTALS